MGVFRKKRRNEKGELKEYGNYIIEYYYQGKRIREATGTTIKTIAKKALTARKGEIAQGRFELAKTQSTVGFEVFAKRYLEHSKNNKRSWQRDETIIKHLVNFFKNRPLTAITPWLIEKYKVERKKKVKEATVDRELSCLKCLFSTAIKWKKATTNPVKEIKFYRPNNQRQRYLSLEERERLLKACPDHLRLVVEVGLNSGLRLGELLGLQWKDVDFTNKILTVKRPKTKDSLTIPMNKSLTKALKCAIKKGTPSDSEDYVFYNSKGERYRSLRTAFENAVKRAGIKDFRFHDLRHSYGSYLVMSGVDLVTVKELLGHRQISTTMRYAHLSQEHKKRAVGLLDTLSNTPHSTPHNKVSGL